MSRATITPTSQHHVTVSAPVRVRVRIPSQPERYVETMLDWSFPSIEAACDFCAACDFTWTLVVPPPARSA